MTARGPTRGAYAVAAIAAALYLAARTAGAGWLIVIMCALIGLLLAATIWPRVALARVRLTASAPRDAVAGEPVDLTITARRAGLGVRLRPLSPPGGWAAVVGDGSTVVEVVPPRRGPITEAHVEVSSAAPFGLIWWRRRRTVALARPLEVAPRRAAAARYAPTGGFDGGDAATPSGIGGDRARGLRDYVPGDPMRLVHWPATARRGQVIVKELEQPERPRLVVAVDLRGEAGAAERAAERAMGFICDALGDGRDVTLHTVERGGPRAAPVRSVLDAGRRLSRAVPGPPPPASATASAVRFAASDA